MNESTEANQSGSGKSENRVKKLYQKPEVRHERVFETMALSYGKVQTTQGQVPCQPQGFVDSCTRYAYH